MNRPCAYKNTCPGIDGVEGDSPFSNLSSEAPDTIDYLSFAFSYDLGGTPPLGQNWSLVACGVTLFVSDTPINAELQAAAAAIDCALVTRNPGTSGIPIYNPPPGPGATPIYLPPPAIPPPTIYWNTMQTCCPQNACGNPICFTVAAGIVPGLNQAQADQHAHAIACLYAAGALIHPNTVGNDPQTATATCPAGETGTPVTINVPKDFIQSQICSRDPNAIAALKQSLNAQALQDAQNTANAALTCVKAGYRICSWSQFLAATVIPPAWPNSTFPAWDGTFNLQSASPVTGFPVWYFLSQSIGGKAVAPNDGAPDYPAGNWQDNDGYVGMYWSAGNWYITVSSTTLSTLAVYAGGTNINDPTGVFSLVFNTIGTIPASLEIAVSTVTCCPAPAWSSLAYTAPTYNITGVGSANGIAAGNSVIVSASCSGVLSSANVQGMVGSVLYTGDVWDAYLTLNVTTFNGAGDVAHSCGGTFEVRQGGTQLAYVILGGTNSSNTVEIHDIDGVRTLNGQMPGTFRIHIKGLVGAASTILVQPIGGAGGLWTSVQSNDVVQSIAYNISFACG